MVRTRTAVVLTIGMALTFGAAAWGQSSILDKRIGVLDCRGLTMETSFDAISRESGVLITVDWESLGGEDLRSSVRSVSFRGCTVRDAVKALFADSDVSSDGIGIRVIGKEAARSGLRSYPIGDLEQALGPDAADQMADLLKACVHPDDWLDNGGKLRLDVRNGMLSAEQTGEGHEQIAHLLQSLRDAVANKNGFASLAKSATVAEPDAEEVLNRRLPGLRFHETPLVDVLDEVATSTRARMIIHWGLLAADGIEAREPVSVDVSGRTLRGAMKLICGASGITYWVRNDIIEVTSHDDAPRDVETRVVDLKPVMEVVSDYAAGMGQRARADGVAEAFSSLVEQAVEADSWRDNGGLNGGMRRIGDLLVMTNTPHANKAVFALMADMQRASRPMTKSVPVGPEIPELTSVNLGDIDLSRSAFEDAMNRLADLSRTQILVDWKSLEGVGISRDTPIKVRLINTTLAKGLTVLIESAGPGGVKVGYIVDEMGIVHVTTGEEAARFVVTRIYNVRDLVEKYLKYHNTGPVTAQRQLATPADAVNSLTGMMESTIFTDSWRDNGGSAGYLHEFAGLLIVTNSVECHKKIAALLDALRVDPTMVKPAQRDWLRKR